jgi:hypothetical protein
MNVIGSSFTDSELGMCIRVGLAVNADLKKIQLVNDGFDEGQRTLLPVAIASLKRSTQLEHLVVTILDALEHKRRLVRLDLSGHHCTLDAGLSLTRALEFSGLKEFSRQLHKQAGCERS